MTGSSQPASGERGPAADAAERVAGWIQRHRSAMFSTALRGVGCPYDAEDIVQDASIDAVGTAERAPEKIDAVGHPARWLCGIVWNLSRRLARDRERDARLLRDATADLVLFQREIRHTPGTPLDRLADRARARLPILTRQQRTVVAGMLGGRTDAEIAARLGIEVGTVRYHRCVAVRALRAALRS